MLPLMRQKSGDDSTSAPRRGRSLGPLLAAPVVLVGVVVTLLIVGGVRAAQRGAADRIMDQRTAAAEAGVAGETKRYLTLLETVAAGVSTENRLTRTVFDTAVAPIAGSGLHGVTAVAFIVAAGPDDTAATQARWRARGAAGLVLQPAPGVTEHFYSIFARTMNPGMPAGTGRDVAGSPLGATALTEARSTGRPAVSDTYVLLRDRGLPAGQRQNSFIFAAPVGAADGPGGFQGWIVLGLRGQEFLGAVLSTAGQGELDGGLVATNADGSRAEVASYAPHGAGDLSRQATLPVADRQWTLATRADSATLLGTRSALPMTVLLGGIALTVLLGWLVRVLATGRSRAERQVRIATAGLREAEAESRRHAGLLGAIMDDLGGDGVGVVDENGAFLLQNPAAHELLGVPDEADGPGDWQEYYGLYRPDGHTPFPLEELPLVLALRGESSNGVEMVVRNAARPDGVLLSVDGRPLDASTAGQRGAIAVMHDITALRRYETDLAVFAGVVAHDLKAPLAVIRGHCEIAAEELGNAPAGPHVLEGRNATARIAIAADRMAGLIDTLLAYTTARDAPLNLAPVPLGPLVDDVIDDRTGLPRPAATPTPEIYVGPLPVVEVDAGMLRHVLDNLVGNSIKYVRPGRAARIDITAADESPGWTRLELADRGIGISDAEKQEIFDTFHRARTATAYAGTGLGLAICRRVVERHGGVIDVVDNPGGGSRFRFTLPLAGVAPAPEPAGFDPEALRRAFAERAAAENARLPDEPDLSVWPAEAGTSHLHPAVTERGSRA